MCANTFHKREGGKSGMSELPRQGSPNGRKPRATASNLWDRLRLPRYKHDHPPVRSANELHTEGLRPLDRFALFMTARVGSMGFFLLILAWTVLWTGYNVLAS